MNYAVSRDTVVLYIFPFLARRVIASFTRFVGYTGTQALYILCTFFPKRVQTYQQSTALPAFSTNCRVFINISGLPRIEPAAPIRLATTDQRRNRLRHRAIHKKDGRDEANELRGQP